MPVGKNKMKKKVAFVVVQLGDDKLLFAEHYWDYGDSDWHEAWEFHRRGKNYIAKIVGRHPTYRFEREFLKVVKIDGDVYLNINSLEPGNFLDVWFAYYSARGHPLFHLKGKFRFVGLIEEHGVPLPPPKMQADWDEDDFVGVALLERVGETTILKAFKE